jgi:phosphoribosylaminoimidazolecarboxamide formyltransferase/IMP cyclohydrolase
MNIYMSSNGAPSLENRKEFAVKAFHTSSHYDTTIFNHFNEKENLLKLSINDSKVLRYGENPHQESVFYGPLSKLVEHIHGKEISYNNLLDIDAAVTLMSEFYDGDPAFGILKHNNACGFAIRQVLVDAYQDALAGDPISAFGGVLISNKTIDLATASAIHELFCEVVIAPAYQEEALELLKGKKNRIILIQKANKLPKESYRSCLNGILVQDRDLKTDQENDLTTATKITPSAKEIKDLLFASKICKHTKSNTIVIAKNQQLLASGTGQTSRVDALNHAIQKAQNFGFDIDDAVMASDAFFPFPDCVEIANKAGVNSVIQPGGSIKDNLSIEYCDLHQMRMVLTGTRHFKH